MSATRPFPSSDCQDGPAPQSGGLTRRYVMRTLTGVRNVARGCLNIVLPPLCLACETRILSHDALCAGCWRQINFIRSPLCDRLGLPLPYGPNFDGSNFNGPQISALAAADPPIYDRARAVAHFDGLMRDLVHRLKYEDNPNCRRLFGRWLTEAGGCVLADADLVVPVPLGRLRLLSRRFNQAHILAAAVARQSGVPVDPLALKRCRSTTRQVGLSRDQRQRNVAGAFFVPQRSIGAIAGRRVVLIDDVITTGATVSAAAKALKKAGAAGVDVLALALVCNTVA